jgi:hypothetical protein
MSENEKSKQIRLLHNAGWISDLYHGNRMWATTTQSMNTTDCNPEISKRLRQRTFLQAIMSSLRSM